MGFLWGHEGFGGAFAWYWTHSGLEKGSLPAKKLNFTVSVFERCCYHLVLWNRSGAGTDTNWHLDTPPCVITGKFCISPISKAPNHESNKSPQLGIFNLIR